ncbi:hypothetical protein BJ508DRAFT_140485 [Ascobolus immersus RN42]|uniref:Secreted protein n=1 Tax=Ascobolus immersus RN42 TaxID=1160509 RepID=A0A3N4I068_ASCIM|nr:hypothetical protein BJ508DRAFT_140485 [Ascobolus immersus RN42]
MRTPTALPSFTGLSVVLLVTLTEEALPLEALLFGRAERLGELRDRIPATNHTNHPLPATTFPRHILLHTQKLSKIASIPGTSDAFFYIPAR